VQQPWSVSLSVSIDGWNANEKPIILKTLTNCCSEPISGEAAVRRCALDVDLLCKTLGFDSSRLLSDGRRLWRENTAAKILQYPLLPLLPSLQLLTHRELLLSPVPHAARTAMLGAAWSYCCCSGDAKEALQLYRGRLYVVNGSEAGFANAQLSRRNWNWQYIKKK